MNLRVTAHATARRIRPRQGRLMRRAGDYPTRFARFASSSLGNLRKVVHNEIDMDVPAERVFAVLSDPRSFARWVVGSKEVRRADPGLVNCDRRAPRSPVISECQLILYPVPGIQATPPPRRRPAVNASARLEPRHINGEAWRPGVLAVLSFAGADEVSVGGR